MLDQIRNHLLHSVDENGVVHQAKIAHRFPVNATIAEVKSLSPPRVEILSGPTIKIDAYVGPTPLVGEICLVLEVARYRIAVFGIEVI